MHETARRRPQNESSASARWKLAYGALFLGFAPLVLGCEAKASRVECAEMLDKYLDMVVAGQPELAAKAPAEAQAAREAAKAQHKADASYQRAARQCESEISRREYRCAMKAPTPETWQACID